MKNKKEKNFSKTKEKDIFEEDNKQLLIILYNIQKILSKKIEELIKKVK